MSREKVADLIRDAFDAERDESKLKPGLAWTVYDLRPTHNAVIVLPFINFSDLIKHQDRP